MLFCKFTFVIAAIVIGNVYGQECEERPTIINHNCYGTTTEEITESSQQRQAAAVTIQGKPGKKGPKGDIGPQGLKGSEGQKGRAGENGVSKSDVEEIMNIISTLNQTIKDMKERIYHLELGPKGKCERDGNLLLDSKCYFITDVKSRSSAQGATACDEVYNGAVLVEVKSSQIQDSLMTFVRTKMTSSSEPFRTGGQYNVGNRRVSWNGKSEETTNFRWHPGHPSSTSSYRTLYVVVDTNNNDQGMHNYVDSYNCRSLCQLQ